MVSYTVLFKRDKILNKVFEEIEEFTSLELVTEIKAAIEKHDKYNYGEIEALNICDEDYWVYIRIIYKNVLFYYKYNKETCNHEMMCISQYEIKMFSEDFDYELKNKSN